MWQGIPEGLDWLIENGARAIVITGEGDNFSAGADISEFSELRRDAETAIAYEQNNSEAFAAVRHCPVPVIAAIAGICFGGGFGLAAAADIRIADGTARFCVPAARLGLAYPADAVGDIVAALGPQWTRIALFTAREFTAADMLRTGFLAEIVDKGGISAASEALAATIAGNAPLSVAASKIAIRAAIEARPDLAVAAIAAGAATFDSADYAEGRAAFIEKRRPAFTGR
jgi:enoyl-CoA hydratase/carnithine racemase